ALNMTHIIDLFPDRYSYEDVNLKVVTDERATTGRTTLQHALSSLAGIFMVTSGCAPLDKLRPMVRFHQPLASLQETIYRAISMYLMAQFMRSRRDLMADWTLAGLEALYHEVHMVNVGFGKRLRSSPGYDANTNALMRLDMFTYGFTQSFDDALTGLESYFQSYLSGDHKKMFTD
ncbi:MAG: hypothetical protein GXP54_13490, partial [Deltaproteobacteria bacterium]|nr:hypothetical protein [Deltaproteobacteria bacterium]